jgi:hypothetical protein
VLKYGPKKTAVDINFYRVEQINTSKHLTASAGNSNAGMGSRTIRFSIGFYNEANNACETVELQKGSCIIKASHKITISSITTRKVSFMFIRHQSLLMALSLLWALLVIDSTPLLAQPDGRTGGRTGGAQFSQVTRLLNTALPTVNVFDAQGKPLSTASLRDCYTVLVFGCLT